VIPSLETIVRMISSDRQLSTVAACRALEKLMFARQSILIPSLRARSSSASTIRIGTYCANGGARTDCPADGIGFEAAIRAAPERPLELALTPRCLLDPKQRVRNLAVDSHRVLEVRNRDETV